MRIFLTVLLIATSQFTSASTVGTLPGELVVDSGVAMYQIPLQLPEGRGGNTPQISITYNSQGAHHSVLGPGFSISGLSVITRCGSTVATDGFRRSPSYSYEDNFCLDGERLIATSGQIGKSGSAYKTELEQYSRITLNGDSLNGSSQFTVKTKSGDVLTYSGNAENSAWMLSTSTDTTGKNPVKYLYDEKNLIVEIDYDIYKIDFNYEDHGYLNINGTEFKINGKIIRQYKKLSNIQVEVNGKVKNTYDFNYYDGDFNANTPIKIKSIQYCDADSNCLPETTFHWVNKATTEFDKTTKKQTSWGVTSGFPWSHSDYTPLNYWVDVDGDRKLDLCKIKTSGSPYENTYNTHIECDLGNGQAFNHPYTAWGKKKQNWWLDIDSDGKSEYCFIDGSNLKCSRFSTTGVSTSSIAMPGGWGSDSDRRWWMDVNGDSRVDFCRRDGSLLVCSINKDGKSFSNKQFSISDWGDLNKSWWVDLDGNGFQDYCRGIANSGVGGTLRCDMFNGAKIQASKDFNVDDWGYEDRRWWVDINGDGASDYCRAVGDSSGPNSRLRCSLGSVGKVSDLKYDFEIANIDWGYSDRRWWLDLNRDGKQDYCRAVGSGSNIFMRCSTMDGQTSIRDYSVQIDDWGYSTKRWWLDTNNDGNIEYCRHTGKKSGTGSYLNCSQNSEFTPQNVSLSSVINGLGHKSYVQFKTLNDPSVYTPAFAENYVSGIPFGHGIVKKSIIPSKPFPYMDAKGPMYVVSKLATENGSDASTLNSYEFIYGKALFHAQGRGFSGFSWIEQKESIGSNLVRTRNTVNNMYYPLSGTVKETYEYLGDESLLNKASYSYDSEKTPMTTQYTQVATETIVALMSTVPTNGEVEDLELYKVNGQEYLKKPDTFIPIAADIMIPVVIPSNEYYRVTRGNSVSYNSDGYPVYYGGVQSLSATEIAQVRSLISGETPEHFKVDSTAGYQTLTKYKNVMSTADIYQVVQSQSVEQSFTEEGVLVSSVTTDNTDVDQFGNVGLVTVSTTATNPVTSEAETFTKQTKSSYTNDTSKWLLGRLTASEAMHTDPAGNTEVRKAAFEYNSSTGLLEKEVSAVGTPLELTTVYTRNSEGEIISSETSGFAGTEGVKSRESLTSKTFSGDTVTIETSNALGHKSVEEAERYNNTTTLTDINGLVAKSHLDGFGRVVKKEALVGKPSQIDTTVQYLPASRQECNLKPNNLIVYCVVTKVEGSGETIQFFDKMKREWRTATLSVGGKRWILTDTFYNTKNQIVKVSRPYYQGDTPQYSETKYDALGRISSVSEPGPAGKADVYVSYDYSPLKVTETDALNREKTTYMNAMGWVIQVDQSRLSTIKNEYTPTGQLAKVTSEGSVIANTYDSAGNKQSTSDPDLGFWQYSYDAFGNLLTQTDAKGQTVKMTYDALNRMTKRVDEKLVVENSKPKSLFTQANWYYDKHNARIWKGALMRVESPGYMKNLTYTNLGQLNKEEVFTTEHTFSREFKYDNYGRIVKDIRPNNFTLENEYDAVTGALTAVWGHPSQFSLQFSPEEYNKVIKPLLTEALEKASDYVNKARELEGQAITYGQRRDEYEWLLDQVQNIAGGTSDINRDVNHKTLTVHRHPSGEVYLEVPDNFILIHNDVSIPLLTPPAYHLKLQGNQLSKVSLEEWASIASSLTATGETAFYGDYNNDGTYDLTMLGISKVMPEIYDDLVRTYFGRLNQLASEIQRLEYVEDHTQMQATNYAAAAAQLVTLAKQTMLIASRYDDLGEQNQTQYDQLTELTEEQIQNNRIYYWKLNSLDAEGRIAAETYGNGLINQYDFNEGNGQLQNIATHKGKQALRLLHYRYDAMDNVKLREDIVTGISESYDYDELDRLKSNRIIDTIGLNKDNPLFNKTNNVNYHTNGNIKYKSDVGNYSYQDANHIHAVTRAGNRTYSYDLNGNMQQGDGKTFEWSSFNKPTKITKGSNWVTFSYDPSRARYLKTNHNGDKTWYLGKAYERIDLSNGDVEHKQFINAGGKLVAINIDKKSTRDGTEASIDRQLRYTHSDALGSVDLVTDIWGNIVDRKNYDAWGKERNFVWDTGETFTQQALMTNRGYTGHEQVDEVDLIHMNGRMYDATIGRFISADSFIQAPSNSQSYNRYSYVLNNPMKYTDPSGHFFKKLFKKIKKYWRTIAAIAIAVIAPYAAAYIATSGAVAAGGWAAAIGTLSAGQLALTGFVAGAIGGAITGRSFKSALIGGIAGAAFGAMHSWDPSGLEMAAKAIAHGAAGGFSSVMQGGQFGDGFTSAFAMQSITLAGGFKAIGAATAQTLPQKIYNAITSAVIGGTVSALSGGKFQNGAVSGAFSRLLNDTLASFANSYKSAHQLEKAKLSIAKAEAYAQAKTIQPIVDDPLGVAVDTGGIIVGTVDCLAVTKIGCVGAVISATSLKSRWTGQNDIAKGVENVASLFTSNENAVSIGKNSVIYMSIGTSAPGAFKTFYYLGGTNFKQAFSIGNLTDTAGYSITIRDTYRNENNE
ncbi:RHS repeat-associated core domain-containing protein [Photobacterium rosenbergii]|uniref:RHS repeat-associated core domain-containing protein n=1 Tax=Photobacterium rosenbergii TaxID=294936 RepID=A0ABU3ZDZ7_9GAMM|nr:RHS repeat-associated core domain-containing protein [Photobacterium rosenbergii]MDV5168329.1 RHS repeat-associated core domain-containing protein [Photobacterium rosenbergii]